MEFNTSPLGHTSELDHDQPPSGPLLSSTGSFRPINEQDYDADIFRGEPPARTPSPVSSTSSSSSSGSSLLGGRFTAIAAVVELAISRWARATSGSSSKSSSSDTSSTRSSVVTLSRPRTIARRRRRPSIATLHSLQSERDLAARFRAREESRHIPREFVLYLPPTSHPRPTSAKAHHTGAGTKPPPQRVSRTTSLPLILSQLDTALKQSSKARRYRTRAISPERSPPPDSNHLHHDYMLPDLMKVPSRPASFTDLSGLRATRKGKGREAPMQSSIPPSVEKEASNRAPKAWWLDVASPTWEDMRAIGKLLHLHPLTLEDILQQDPREKLELFPRLGYYFVSFRAIESRATRQPLQRGNSVDIGQSDLQDDGGIVGEINVYLVVFREGVCSFHFTDIAEHTDRVRNRVMLLAETVNMSSDWIAHGILDSIVDSFFPFLEEVEKEVVDVEDLVFSFNRQGGEMTRVQHPKPSSPTISSLTKTPEAEKTFDLVESPTILNEKSQPQDTVKTRFSLPRPTITLYFRRLKRAIKSLYVSISIIVTVEVRRTPGNSTASTLHRMARTRRLVTSLTRLLAAKSEVVAQIRKRLLTSGQSGLGNGAGKDDDIEVAIYMGDVQDHILTLQHSLAHYERMLSQSHPTYLSQLRLSVVQAKSGQDKAIMLLTIVSMAVLCNQAMIGIFSMNVNVPHNLRYPNGRYYVFGVVVALVFIILGIFLSFVRRWWLQAKRRHSRISW